MEDRNPQPITVLCVDDNPQMTRLLERAVNLEPGMRSLGVLSSADDLIDEVKRLSPNVVLIDLTMPGRDPLDAVGELSKSTPDTRVIVFSGHSDPQYEQSAMSRGAWGFVLKDGGIDPILNAIRDVASGVKVTRNGAASFKALKPRI